MIATAGEPKDEPGGGGVVDSAGPRAVACAGVAASGTMEDDRPEFVMVVVLVVRGDSWRRSGYSMKVGHSLKS